MNKHKLCLLAALNIVSPAILYANSTEPDQYILKITNTSNDAFHFEAFLAQDDGKCSKTGTSLGSQSDVASGETTSIPISVYPTTNVCIINSSGNIAPHYYSPTVKMQDVAIDEGNAKVVYGNFNLGSALDGYYDFANSKKITVKVVNHGKKKYSYEFYQPLSANTPCTKDTAALTSLRRTIIQGDDNQQKVEVFPYTASYVPESNYFCIRVFASGILHKTYGPYHFLPDECISPVEIKSHKEVNYCNQKKNEEEVLVE